MGFINTGRKEGLAKLMKEASAGASDGAGGRRERAAVRGGVDLFAMNPPSSAQDDNLRRLLDQRAARGDTHHTRFPSLTEFSDSPSIYSHPHFSPRTPHPDYSSPPQFDFPVPPQYARSAFNAMRSRDASSTSTDTHGLDGPISDVRLERSASLESMQLEDEDLES